MCAFNIHGVAKVDPKTYFYRVPGTGDTVQISQFLVACMFVCPSRPKRLGDFIVNEIKEDGMMELWYDGMYECMNVGMQECRNVGIQE